MFGRGVLVIALLLALGACHRVVEPPPKTPDEEVRMDEPESTVSEVEEVLIALQLQETTTCLLGERVEVTAEIECIPTGVIIRPRSRSERDSCPRRASNGDDEQPRPCSGIPVHGVITREDMGTFRIRFPRECPRGPVTASYRLVGNPLRADFVNILCLDTMVVPSHPMVDCGIPTYWGATLVERLESEADQDREEIEVDVYRTPEGLPIPILYWARSCRGEQLYRCDPYRETCGHVENVEETLIALGL